MIEFVAGLTCVRDGPLPVPERHVLRPLGLGKDRLRFAKRFLEFRSVREVEDIVRERLGRDAAISDADWARLTRVASKWGLERLLDYILLAVNCSRPEVRDPAHNAVYYLLEVVPNPRHALEVFDGAETSSPGEAE